MSHPSGGPVHPHVRLPHGQWLAGFHVHAGCECHLWQAFLLPLQNEVGAHGIGHQPELFHGTGFISWGAAYWLWQRCMPPWWTCSRMALGVWAWMRLSVRSNVPCVLYHHASLSDSGPVCGWTCIKVVPCPSSVRPLSFVKVAVSPSWLPGQQGPQELPVDPGPPPVHEIHMRHIYLPQPPRNPNGCQTDGRLCVNMCSLSSCGGSRHAQKWRGWYLDPMCPSPGYISYQLWSTWFLLYLLLPTCIVYWKSKTLCQFNHNYFGSDSCGCTIIITSGLLFAFNVN